MAELPDKQYFKIGEVSRLTGVKPHVLRYWETEFSSIRPQKSRTGQRLYRRCDVEQLLQIKQLLYGERYTIAGAAKRLRQLRREQGTATVTDEIEVLQTVRDQLEEILTLVERDD